MEKYVFDKAYRDCIAYLVLEFLSKVYKCRAFLRNDRHQENPLGTIDETFTSSIHLLGTNDRYNLLLYDQQMNETPSEFQPDQEMCETYSEFEDSRTV